jgi:hypothetical protein
MHEKASDQPPSTPCTALSRLFGDKRRPHSVQASLTQANTGCVKATFLQKDQDVASGEELSDRPRKRAAAAGADVHRRQSVRRLQSCVVQRWQAPGSVQGVIRGGSMSRLPRASSLGCNNVHHPDANANGTVTYTFTGRERWPQPVSSSDADGLDDFSQLSLLIDVEGTADHHEASKRSTTGKVAEACTRYGRFRASVQEGWLERPLRVPTFKNQGQCRQVLVHGRDAAKRCALNSTLAVWLRDPPRAPPCGALARRDANLTVWCLSPHALGLEVRSID